jgi:hypothetical protein
MKKFFSLFAAVLFAASMMADEAVLQYTGGVTTNLEGEGVNNAATLGLDEDLFTVLADKGSNQNFPGLNQANDIRLYADKNSGNGNIITVSIASGTITSIVLDIKQTATFVVKAGETAVTEAGGAYAINAASFSIQNTTTGATTQLRLNKITITYESGEVPPTPAVNYYLVGSEIGWAANEAYKLAANPAVDGEFMIDHTAVANEGLKVLGVEGETQTWYPDGMGNELVLSEAGDYTIYFRPDGQGGEGWYEGFIYAEYHEPATPLSLTEFIAAAPTTEVTLKPLTVIFASGKNTYVIDEDGVALVIFDTNKTYYDGTLTAGKVLTGQKATYTKYKNQDEIVPTNTAAVSDGIAPTPTELNAAPTDANINHYVSFENVAATKTGNNFFIYSNVQLYGATSALKPTEEGNYDVEGLYIVYNGNNGMQPEIIVTALAPASATAISNTADEIKAFKTIENGQLVIIKNGVRYDATGAVIR